MPIPVRSLKYYLAIKALGLLGALWPCPPLAAQAPLTLPAVLRQARTASLHADLAALAQREADADRAEAQAAFLPDLQFQGGHMTLDQDPAHRAAAFTVGPLPGLGSVTVPAQEQPLAQKASWRFQVTASYAVYDFGRRASLVAAARAKAAAVTLRGLDDVARAQAEAAGRYLAVMALQARKSVVQQRRLTLQDHLRDARSLFEQGVVARNDLLRAEVALRAVDDAGRGLDNALASARASLDLALGQASGGPRELPAALAPPPPLPWDEAQVRLRASEANRGVQALAAKVRAAAGQVDFRNREGAPTVVAQLGHSYEQNRFLTPNSENSLYLGLSWKVFDGARPARLSRARAGEDTARRELVEARRQTENAAAAAYRDYREALAAMTSAQVNLEAARENLRIVNEQYLQAFAKGGDVLDAETLLAECTFSLSDQLCRAYGLQAGLLALLGEDLEAFYAHATPEP